MSSLFVQYWAILTIMKISTIAIAKENSKLCQMLNKPSKIYTSGEISENLAICRLLMDHFIGN